MADASLAATSGVSPGSSHEDRSVVVRAAGAVYTYPASRKQPSRSIGPVSLEIARGQRVAVIGPNGCGKSTLVHMLSGASTPRQGAITLFGGDPPRAVRHRIGVVFQHPALDGLLTVRETFRLAGRLLHLPPGVIRQRTDELVMRLGIEDRIHDRIGSLSGGLARRVDLGRAVMHQPDVLLLDEPTAGLDDESASDFNAMLDALVRDGVTVITATHTLSEVRSADRVLVMIGGLVAIDKLNTRGEQSGPVRARLLCDAHEHADAFRELGLAERGGGVWQFEPESMTEEALAAVVRSAVRARGSLGAADGTMQDYFRDAEVAIASGAAPSKADTSSVAEQRPVSLSSARAPSLRSLLSAFVALILRDVLLLVRRPSRIAATILTPALLWIFFAGGFAGSVTAPGGGDDAYTRSLAAGAGLLVVTFASIFGALGLIRDRETGSLQAVLVGPTPRWLVIAARVISGAALAWLQAVPMLLAAVVLGGQVIAGGILGATGMLLLTAFGVSGACTALAWHFRSIEGFHGVMSGVLMPAWLLSGAVFPPGSASGGLRVVMAFNPLTYAQNAVAGLLGSTDVGPRSLVITSVFGIGCFVAAIAAARGDAKR